MENFPYLWLGIAIVALVIEANTAALVSLWFVPAALVSMSLAFANVPLWLQVLTFLVLSALFLVISLKFFKGSRFLKKMPTNADALIGELAVVTEPIDNINSKGCVRIKGQTWSARAQNENTKYADGEVLEVVAIEGVKLIVTERKK